MTVAVVVGVVSSSFPVYSCTKNFVVVVIAATVIDFDRGRVVVVPVVLLVSSIIVICVDGGKLNRPSRLKIDFNGGRDRRSSLSSSSS